MISRLGIERARFRFLKYLSLFSWLGLALAVYLTIGLAWLRYATVANESAQSAAHATAQADGRKPPRSEAGAPSRTTTQQPAQPLVALPAVFAPVEDLIEALLPSLAALDSDKRLEVQGRLIELLLVIVVVFMSLVPALYIPYKLKVARTKYPIQTYIAESERERNEFMLNRYKDAQHVTLYAGSFDWICADKQLAAVVIKLAAEDKIEFISSYPPEKVSDALKEHPEVCAAVMARFRQRRGQKVVCSLISYHANHSFMYLHAGPHIEKPRICEVTDAEEGRYLLKAMGELLRAEKPVVAAVPA